MSTVVFLLLAVALVASGGGVLSVALTIGIKIESAFLAGMFFTSCALYFIAALIGGLVLGVYAFVG